MSAFVLLTLMCAGNAGFAAVPLDRGFGDDGAAGAFFSTIGSALPTAVVTDPRGRIVIAAELPERNDWGIARFMPDGQRDATFGDGGEITLDLGGYEGRGVAIGAGPADIAFQQDGRILVLGELFNAAQMFGPRLLRLNEDGSLDRSFGDSGIVVPPGHASPHYSSALAVDAHDRILAFGVHNHYYGGPAVMVGTRYLPDGEADPSFGDDGRVESAGRIPSAIVVEDRGDITVAGRGIRGSEPNNSEDWFISRYDDDGNVVSSFGDGGSSTFDRFLEIGDYYQTYADPPSLMRNPDGSLVLGGFWGYAASRIEPGDGEGWPITVLARFRSDGRLDRTFADDGAAVMSPTPPRDDIELTATKVAMQCDGKFIAAGHHYQDHQVMSVARLRNDGSPDYGFGSGRPFRYPDLMTHAQQLVVTPDCHTIMVGTAVRDDGYHYVRLVRLRTGTCGGHPGSVRRSCGTDRFSTAAELALDRFEPEVRTVYLATGGSFPDALAGGPLAGSHDAPLLLASPDELPPATASALATLRPERIVALGGRSAISDAVLQQASSAAFGAVTDRIAGPNRYETAAQIARKMDGPIGTVFVATASAFPDAVAGGPSTGGAPILLVERDHVPEATTALLAELRPRRVVALGGTSAIADATLASAATTAHAHADRISGPDRYATAAAIAAAGHEAPTVVFVATGENFPDALSAGPAAASIGAPIVLTGRNSLPKPTADYLASIDDLQEVIVLGGETAVSAAVFDKLRALTVTSRSTQ